MFVAYHSHSHLVRSNALELIAFYKVKVTARRRMDTRKCSTSDKDVLTAVQLLAAEKECN